MSAIQLDLITDHLKNHVTRLADEIGQRHVNAPHALHKAVNYISDEWSAMGYQVDTQNFSAKGVRCLNLVAERAGTDSDASTILVVTNYDSSKDCPGANDNASSLAAMLEISRIMRQYAPKHSVRFVALSNEKPPFVDTEKMGSWVYAHQARECFDNIKCVIILGSLGYYNEAPDSQLYPPLLGRIYPDRANYLAMASNLVSAPGMFRFNRLFKQHARFPSQMMALPNIFSRHHWYHPSPFSVCGYKNFIVTDTGHCRYPFANSGRDTAEKLDYQSLSNVTLGLTHALADFSLAKA